MTSHRNITFGKPFFGPEERLAVEEVLNGDILVHGPRVKEFEAAFKNFTGAQHALTVSSCTAGLHLAYFYLGIGPGDEVIVPAQTHTATAHAVELSGGRPVFVDCERETGNIDIDQLSGLITEKTKALSIVHFLGMPVDMQKICDIGKRHNIFVVEDCALAIGTYYKGIHAGLHGDLGAFSFYPVKHLTTAEGGMLTIKDASVAAKIERQRAFGVDRTVDERKIPGIYDVTMLGFNYRMNEIEAALGIEQLKKAEQILELREANYNSLMNGLSDISEISLLNSTSGDFKSSYYCLSILLNQKLTKLRFELVNLLNQQGVGTSVYYPKPVPYMIYYREKYGYRTGQFPNAAWISDSSIALPVGPHLNQDDMQYICEALKKAIHQLG